MNKALVHIKKMQKGLKEWAGRMGPRVDYLIDKYRIIKVGCVVGTVVNCYLTYDGAMTVIVLKGVKSEVDKRKELFYKRVEKKKQQVLALLQQLQRDNLLENIQPNQQIL